MTKQITDSVILATLAVGLALFFSTSVFAIADLSDWTGENNAPPDPEAENNNYALIGSAPQTSAGGFFQARRTRANGGAPRNNAWLSDASLSGSLLGTDFQYGFQESLTVTGTFTFANPNNADPNWFFGFYNSGIDPSSANGIHRVGLSLGGQSTNLFRIQANARDNSATTPQTIFPNLTTDGTNAGTNTLQGGTYPFTFSWTPNVTSTTHLFQASIGSGADLRFRNTTVNTANFNSADVFDHFGFFQFGETFPPAPATDQIQFSVTVSNIDYTGDTNIPGIPGDFDDDGVVDAGDYATWRKNDGTSNALLNDNGLGIPVGTGHYNLWRANYGNPPGSGSLVGAAIPEPSTLVLMVVTLGLARMVAPRPVRQASFREPSRRGA